jgi:hypothetical protein
MSKRLDSPANDIGLTKLPTIEDVMARDGVDGTEVIEEPFDHLVVMIALCNPQHLDEQKVLNFTLRELRQAEDWLAAIHLKASDNIIRKKRLQQPECCKGVIDL